MSTFWNAWRKEIIRGAVIFVAVVCVGLLVIAAVHRVKQGVKEGMPMALRELQGAFDPSLFAGPRDTATTWNYGTKLGPGQSVWIHDLNGSVTVEPVNGDSLYITAVKTYRRSDPTAVRIMAAPYADGVAVCALWGRNGMDTCLPRVDYAQGHVRRSDVAVEFIVRVPRGVRIWASTVNGDVRVSGASAPVVARTVSGGVDAETQAGPVEARAVNGGVHVRMRAFGDTGGVQVFTVNGPISVELPARLDADVEATTVNGTITTDYPLPVTGGLTLHNLRGTLGAGGRPVKITTVNGSITLKKLGGAPAAK